MKKPQLSCLDWNIENFFGKLIFKVGTLIKKKTKQILK